VRFLITGGFGFIGGRLGQYLMAQGHQVILGSRAAFAAPPPWLPKARVCLTQWDSREALEKICDRVDVLIHAAGMNAKDCAADPLAALEFNGAATARVLEAAENSGVPRFLYLSTAHVYASPLQGKINESTSPYNPHPYATSHLAGENKVLERCASGRIQGVVVRLSNVFGAPTHKYVDCWMLLANDLCRQAVEHGVMRLHSCGNQRRDFVPMTEVCRALSILACYPDKQINVPVFNMGSGKTNSIMDMARLIQGRCQVILGFYPGLEFLDKLQSTDDVPIDFEFQTAKLSDLGVTIDADCIPEIDNLLIFCKRYFSKGSINE
jgi:UDP-glucose 4-epimerase